jgi:hypothetical protein
MLAASLLSLAQGNCTQAQCCHSVWQWQNTGSSNLVAQKVYRLLAPRALLAVQPQPVLVQLHKRLLHVILFPDLHQYTRGFIYITEIGLAATVLVGITFTR